MYEIPDYSYKQAKRLGVTINPSTNKKKKIDVYKDGDKIATIGRRQSYKKRHEKDRHIKGTPGYYADQILW